MRHPSKPLLDKRWLTERARSVSGCFPSPWRSLRSSYHDRRVARLARADPKSYVGDSGTGWLAVAPTSWHPVHVLISMLDKAGRLTSRIRSRTIDEHTQECPDIARWYAQEAAWRPPLHQVAVTPGSTYRGSAPRLRPCRPRSGPARTPPGPAQWW